jgi:drug/metabolite transporter (DMT)-like permease
MAPSPIYAALWMAGAAASFSVLAVVGREAQKTVDVFEVTLVRAALTVLLTAGVAVALGGAKARLSTRRPGLHLTRNTFQLGGQIGWLYALMLIPLAELFAFEFTAPIWAAALATVVLRERLTTARAGAAVLGFAGVLVILRPGFSTIGPGSVAVLLAALCFACSMLCVKQLTRTESPLAILFYQGLMQLPVALVLAWPTIRAPDGHTALMLLMVTLTSLSAHYCAARAFAIADAMVVAPLDFLRLPLIAIVGAVLYAEPLDPLVFGGASLIVAANLWSILAERRRRALGVDDL